MTAQTDPYVRVYYGIMDDPKFADVYPDKAALGTWLTLLIHADALYPAPATLPHGVRIATVEKLVQAGLIDLLSGHRYRVHGLEPEREKRVESARYAADVKYHGVAEAQRLQAERNASAMRAQSVSNADPMPLRAEPLRSSPSRSNPSLSSPTPAGAKKNGSNDQETDEERLARYRSLMVDESRSADIRRAAQDEVERLEILRVH